MKSNTRIDEIIKTIEDKKKMEKSNITKEFLIVDTGSNLIALQLEYLREVFDLNDKRDIVPIPFTPEYIMGIINVRGEILPVLSILNILGLNENISHFNKMITYRRKN